MSLGVAVAVIISVVSFAGGIYCIIRYARTRQVGFVTVGLLLMFILPGVLLLGALGVYRPEPMGCYAPPYETTTIFTTTTIP